MLADQCLTIQSASSVPCPERTTYTLTAARQLDHSILLLVVLLEGGTERLEEGGLGAGQRFDV